MIQIPDRVHKLDQGCMFTYIIKDFKKSPLLSNGWYDKKDYARLSSFTGQS